MIRDMIQSLLSAAVPSRAGVAELSDIGAEASADRDTPTVEEARERRRQAHTAYERARIDSLEAGAALERVNAVISKVDMARAEAKAAETAAAAVTQAWAEAGAPADRPPSDSELMERAASAARRRDDAETAAAGAEAAMPQLLATQQSAEWALGTARWALIEAVKGLLFATIESDFVALERASLMSRPSYLRILALAHALRYGRVHGIPASGWSDIERRLASLTPRKPNDEELRAGASEWIDFAKRLLADPEAK